MSFQCPESREQDQVKINFALVLPGRLTLFISGIAANENSDFVQRYVFINI